MMDLKHYVLENKTSLRSLAESIRTKSGATGNLTVVQMRELVYGLISEESMKALIDRSIKEIEIPLSVTTIGRSAFTYCNSLENVKLHEGITFIGASAFSNCGALKEFEFPKGISSLEFGVLQSCSNLKKVTIPDGVTSIKQQSIGYCAWLPTLSLPNSITEISLSAFVGDTRLETIYCDWAEGDVEGAPWGAATDVEIIYLRKGCTEGVQLTLNTEGTAYTVTGYTGTETEVYIASTYKGLPITEISDNAFDPQNGINMGGATKVEIAEGITKIGDYAFAMNAALETVILPSTLESIGTLAFDTCSSLRNIEIPDSVTSIGDSAFGYSGLYSATLGRGCLWSVTNEIFTGCNSLTDIYVLWDDGNNDGSPWGATNATIHYANGVVVNPM